MKSRLAALVISFLLFGSAFAQEPAPSLTGSASDAISGQPLSGATVSLLYQRDSTLLRSTVTSEDGNFEFKELAPDSLILTISYVGYQQYISFITLRTESRDLGNLQMNKQGEDLEGVVIVARVPPVVQRGDTAQYNASQFKVNPDASAEDIIKKMPGITVDRTGNVTAQGEQVRTVTVDGKRFFGDDATATLRNLPAEIIDKIQVFDRLSDQAQFTGFDDGNATKSINIVTKPGTKNGQFGRVYAGYGTDERYAAGGNVSFFKGDRRISLVGLFNNINQQNFSSEDILGVSGGSGGGGRGGRGGFGRGNNFFVGQQSGISSTNALGINYTDMWGKKMEVNGSYFFNQSSNSNDQISNAQYFLQDTATQFYDETNLSDADNFNNRANLRIEYTIDSSNSIIFSPSLSFQNNDRVARVNGVRYYTIGELLSRTGYSSESMNNGFNSRNNLLYRHAFPKKGRTISVNLRADFDKRDGESYLQSVNEYFDSGQLSDTLQQFTNRDVDGRTLSANISYTEPVGKKGQLQLSYAPSFSKNTSDQEVFQWDNGTSKYDRFDTTLSNTFDNRTETHNADVRYRLGDRDNMFSVGVGYRTTLLKSDQVFPQIVRVRKDFQNVLPSLMWRKKFNPRESIRLFYRASTNTPSVTQLQNVIDNSNPLFITMGHPNLEQTYSHMLSLRYTFTNTGKGKSFFANVFMQQASDYIGNATYIAANDSLIGNGIILPRGAQLSRPVNMDGYTSLRSLVTYGLPLRFIKSNLNLNGGFTWSKIPGRVNDAKSVSDNFGYNAGAVISSNISEYIDFTLSYNASFNKVNNSLQPQLDNDYVSQQAGLQFNLLSKNGWFLQNDLLNQSYSGLSEGFNQSYWLWNAGVGKKFLKNQAGELKLSVFDLLKQNQSITRNVTESYVEDVQNEVLTQYFLLSFTYKLRNFGTAPARSGGGNGQGRSFRAF